MGTVPVVQTVGDKLAKGRRAEPGAKALNVRGFLANVRYFDIGSARLGAKTGGTNSATLAATKYCWAPEGLRVRKEEKSVRWPGPL